MIYKPTGITQQLADYIKNNLKKGYNLDSLRFSLQTQGYSKISIEKAIEIANKQIAEEIPPIKEKPEITYKIIAENQDTDSETIIKINPEKKSFWQRVFG